MARPSLRVGVYSEAGSLNVRTGDAKDAGGKKS